MSKYNGWTNRATWNVNLWLANDEPMYRAVESLKEREGLTAANLEALARDLLGDATPDDDKLDDANWAEIARNW